ncbi:hypothetical protein DFJ69_4242 [Thermomonospora umbrina]|uniref:Uncharacterized protein n=2 Tax=Thermomonospora umbrina TaxID=111806 RepID=A0A3D9ST17_9ACTN|nr:hypothetical protein DFJ69_4242 [Thermomonospora umbrina]
MLSNMSSVGGVLPGIAPEREPAALAMRIGLVAAEAALASFARNLDLDEVEAGCVDFQGAIGPAEWPVFSLVLDTLAGADPRDDRPLDERRVDALNDLARICLAAKRARAA